MVDFMEYHSRRFPRQRMAEHLVGTLSASEKATPVDEAYLELAKEVLAAVPNRGFAPPRYWAKLVLLLGATFWLEARLLLGELGEHEVVLVVDQELRRALDVHVALHLEELGVLHDIAWVFCSVATHSSNLMVPTLVSGPAGSP